MTYALLASDGRLLWRVAITRRPAHLVGHDGDRFYLVAGDLLAIHQTDGSVLWCQALAPGAVSVL